MCAYSVGTPRKASGSSVERTEGTSKPPVFATFLLILTSHCSAFCHKQDCNGLDLAVGQNVSFVFEQGAKGAAAKKVQLEEGGTIAEQAEEEDGAERELGIVKVLHIHAGSEALPFVYCCREHSAIADWASLSTKKRALLSSLLPKAAMS